MLSHTGTTGTGSHGTGTLRQRRSKSPVSNRKHNSPNNNNGAEAEPLILHPDAASSQIIIKDKQPAKSRWMLFLILAAVTLAPFGGAFLYGVVVYLGFYNPDPHCPAKKIDYPWCSHSFLHARVLPPPLTSQEWIQLRTIYQQSIATAGSSGRSSLAPEWDTPDATGFLLPFTASLEIQNSLAKGRGLFATAVIPKGTQIWDSRYRAVFPNECVGRLFLNALTDEQKCDALFWGYINDFYGNGIQYMLDLDGHGYINHDGDDPNAIHHFEHELDTDRYMVSAWSWMGGPFRAVLPDTIWKARNIPGAYGLYAKRDIQPGEEITYDYQEIYLLGWIDWFTMFILHSLPPYKWMVL
ncbi:expressed unknown protein [Seminavis robusta]|uniref:SET domain-containing protein n=1 Tax=Seminavis robusta TaxID=568900 RepID=A0A9N8DLD1_9STRA|nr:expressed unknown protein [Seminavis robusta]|eukprot:Sro145_g067290.1 n/a (354) ;mRNA; r:47010-48071